MSRAEEPKDDGLPQLTHLRVLGSRMFLHTWIRWILAVAITVGAAVGHHVIGVEELDVTAFLLLGAGMATYNGVAWWIIRTRRSGRQEDRALLVRVHYASIILDYLALSVAIWLVGGVRSPFLPFFLVHAIISCLMLPRRDAIIFHFMAYAFLVALVVLEWTGLVPPRLPPGAVASTEPLDGRYAFTEIVIYGILFALTAVLLLSLAQRFRRGEKRVRFANRELGRLSRARRDFLDIALHNIKAPIGATTMFLKNLKKGLGGEVTEKQADWLDRSLRRLDGISGFLADLHLLSRLEAGKVDAKTEEVDVAAMVRSVVEELRDLAGQRRHTLALSLGDDLPPVRGIGLLLREAVANYVTNAIKYTPEGGRITVRAVAIPPGVRIEVADTGIGISPEDQERLFTEFARIRQKHRILGRTEGSGLGLSIVKRIVTSHGGKVSVSSQPGKGSTFGLDLPAA
ncbi:MAG: HAMP domain-containing sensor histidine kinase [Planctomycetota bacterium]